ncbi:sulfotransferase family 2 domain-containing protein [Thiogranum longum]
MLSLRELFVKRQKRLLHGAYRAFVLSRFRDVSKRQYVVLDQHRLAYLAIPKAACSTIKYKLLELSEPSALEQYRENVHCYPWHTARRLRGEQLDYTTFTFVRNPLDRLASMYKNKFEDWHLTGERFQFENYLFGVLYQNMSFDEFVDVISDIPDNLADPHFKSQYSICYNNGRRMVEHIWNLEEADIKQAEIEQRTGLADLPVINRSLSTGWSQYYSPQSFEKALRRYEKDIETFGYEEAIEEAGKRID